MATLKTCPCCKSIYPPDMEIEELMDTVCDECGVSQSIDSMFQARQIKRFKEILPILTANKSPKHGILGIIEQSAPEAENRLDRLLDSPKGVRFTKA